MEKVNTTFHPTNDVSQELTNQLNPQNVALAQLVILPQNRNGAIRHMSFVLPIGTRKAQFWCDYGLNLN